MDDIATTVSAYILSEFLPGEDPAQLRPDTPLITTGVLDSLATLKLVAFLEENFGIEIAAREVSPEHMNTVADIAHLVASKGSVS